MAERRRTIAEFGATIRRFRRSTLWRFLIGAAAVAALAGLHYMSVRVF